MHRNLQSVIQIFVRVVFRSIGRQKKHLHFVLTFFQPVRNKLAMMNLQIVQNQEHLPFRVADQTLQETEQALLVHGVLINHETDFPVTADCGDHIDALLFRFHRQYGRMTLGRKTTLYDFTVADSGLVCPIDPGVFCLCTL